MITNDLKSAAQVVQACKKASRALGVEFYLYPTVSTALIHLVKPESTR